MTAKKQSKGKTRKTADFDKEELFAFAYLKHMGNGAAAAREVFGLKNDNSAYVQASKLLRKAKVQQIVDEFLSARREQHRKLMEQGSYYLTMIAQQLLQIIRDEETPFDDCMRAMETLSRLAGFELSETVTVARVRAEAARPVSEQRPHPENGSSRRVIFLLSPPPIPSGGVPTPALEQQWQEMGFRPSLEP